MKKIKKITGVLVALIFISVFTILLFFHASFDVLSIGGKMNLKDFSSISSGGFAVRIVGFCTGLGLFKFIGIITGGLGKKIAKDIKKNTSKQLDKNQQYQEAINGIATKASNAIGVLISTIATIIAFFTK